MYIELADAFVLKDQPARAILCLEWVAQACPGTPQAETAKGRLARDQKPGPHRRGVRPNAGFIPAGWVIRRG